MYICETLLSGVLTYMEEIRVRDCETGVLTSMEKIGVLHDFIQIAGTKFLLFPIIFLRTIKTIFWYELMHILLLPINLV